MIAALAEAPVAVPGPAASDAEYCAFLRPRFAGLSESLPWAVAAPTRIDAVAIDCALRTVSYDKFVAATLADTGPWSREDIQLGWNEFVCDKDLYGDMARRGWRFTQKVTFQSGERVTQDVNC
ncbi:MAG TPA: hypothetical protein VFZ91_10505 [Allosphingosinicella sp.]